MPSALWTYYYIDCSCSIEIYSCLGAKHWLSSTGRTHFASLEWRLVDRSSWAFVAWSSSVLPEHPCSTYGLFGCLGGRLGHHLRQNSDSKNCESEEVKATAMGSPVALDCPRTFGIDLLQNRCFRPPDYHKFQAANSVYQSSKFCQRFLRPFGPREAVFRSNWRDLRSECFGHEWCSNFTCPGFCLNSIDLISLSLAHHLTG